MSRWRLWIRSLTRNRLAFAGTIMVVIMVLTALSADIIAPYDPADITAGPGLSSPSSDHWFGTDRFGRDILSRVIHGSRISLFVAIVSVTLSVVTGAALGLVSGFLYGGWTDTVLGRLMDAVFSFPALLLAVAIAGALGPGMTNALIAITVVFAPLFYRLVRGSVMSERNREYVEAARVAGARDHRIMFVHVLPNVVSPLIVQATIALSSAILTEASLSYLGLGISPPTPSWGSMIGAGQTFIELAPWVSAFPGIAIMLGVLAFNIFGDGLRDLFDPRALSR